MFFVTLKWRLLLFFGQVPSAGTNATHFITLYKKLIEPSDVKYYLIVKHNILSYVADIVAQEIEGKFASASEVFDDFIKLFRVEGADDSRLLVHVFVDCAMPAAVGDTFTSFCDCAVTQDVCVHYMVVSFVLWLLFCLFCPVNRTV